MRLNTAGSDIKALQEGAIVHDDGLTAKDRWLRERKVYSLSVRGKKFLFDLPTISRSPAGDAALPIVDTLIEEGFLPDDVENDEIAVERATPADSEKYRNEGAEKRGWLDVSVAPASRSGMRL